MVDESQVNSQSAWSKVLFPCLVMSVIWMRRFRSSQRARHTSDDHNLQTGFTKFPDSVQKPSAFIDDRASRSVRRSSRRRLWLPSRILDAQNYSRQRCDRMVFCQEWSVRGQSRNKLPSFLPSFLPEGRNRDSFNHSEKGLKTVVETGHLELCQLREWR
ncbi:hypothetical protein C8J56DRAFT_458017 [Mycena floridula]|nr:hypothetical protein C8J56DRAFT_458017 [Mycena floridula]